MRSAVDRMLRNAGNARLEALVNDFVGLHGIPIPARACVTRKAPAHVALAPDLVQLVEILRRERDSGPSGVLL
jgi:hypothetical protein